MGNSYQFAVAKKGTIPEKQEWDDDTGWTCIGNELDREDWISNLFCKYSDPMTGERYTKKSITDVIKCLNQLDREVETILDDERYDMAFRRRLAKGLVSNIYGYREYHYNYPKRYFAEDSYRIQNWTKQNWEDYTKIPGTRYVQDVLKQLLPYCDGTYDIKLFMW